VIRLNRSIEKAPKSVGAFSRIEVLKNPHCSGFIFTVLLLLGAGNIFGQEILHLSPREAVELAIRNNLTLQNARLTLDNKQRASDLVWNQFLPTISVNGILAHQNFPTTQQSVTLPQWGVNGTLLATLDFSFALVAGIKAILSDYQAGLATYDKARLQMERDIRKNYNNILLLEESVALSREGLANAERQAAIAEANYRAGLAPRLAWLQAQVSVANQAPTITDLENNLKALQATFAMTLGLPYDTQFALEPLLEGDFEISLDLAELISRATSGRPDIIELQRSIEALQLGRQARALQLYTPYLRFQWSMSATFNPRLDPWRNNWFNNGNWNKGGNFSITLGYSLNTLFSFTKEGQGLKDMDNQLTSLYIYMAQAITGTELEIYTKVNSLARTQATAEVQRAAVELAELSYNLTEEAYRAGLQDFQTVENSAFALRQARAQLLVQQFNYLNDLIDLEYAMGVPFGTLSSRY
jgi:outer membrane protein TolC